MLGVKCFAVRLVGDLKFYSKVAKFDIGKVSLNLKNRANFVEAIQKQKV